MPNSPIFVSQQGPQGLTGPGYYATSATSTTPGVGSKTFTTQTGLAYVSPIPVEIVSAGAPSAYMLGTVTSYSGTSLVVNVTIAYGSGAHTDWVISVAPGYNPQFIVASGVPSSGTGNNGDMYINSTTSDVYGPKMAGSWGGIVCNIKGNTGPQGIGYNPRGAYSSANTYAQGDLVSSSGTGYFCLAANGPGNVQTPGSTPTYWQNVGTAGLSDPGSNGLIKRTALNTTAIATGADLPVFVASGSGHAAGAVPDPGASAGSTRYLREDATFSVPPGFAPPFGYQTQAFRMTPTTASIYNGGGAATYQFQYLADVLASDFDFAPITPVGNPSLMASAQDIEFATSPLGLWASDTKHYIYILDTWTPANSEAVLVSAPATHSPAATSLGTNCWLSITCSYAHTAGQFTIVSATNGVAEANAWISSFGGGGWRLVLNGSKNSGYAYIPYSFYAPVYISAVQTPYVIDGLNKATVNVYGVTGVAFDINQSGIKLQGISFTAIATQTSGGRAVWIGHDSVTYNVTVDHCTFGSFYDHVVNTAGGYHRLQACMFNTWLHTAITNNYTGDLVDTFTVTDCAFNNGGVSTPTVATIATYGGGLSWIGGWVWSNDTTSVPFGLVTSHSIASSGLRVIGVYSQNVLCPIVLGTTGSGFFQQVTISGNNIVLPNGGAYGTGIIVSGAVQIGVISGNTIQGNGAANTAGVNFYGTSNTDWTMYGNTFIGLVNGYMPQSGGCTATIGPTHMSGVTTPIYNAGTGVQVENVCPMTVAQLGPWANGSHAFCTDAKNPTDDAGAGTFDATPVAGGHGNNVTRKNGTWRCG